MPARAVEFSSMVDLYEAARTIKEKREKRRTEIRGRLEKAQRDTRRIIEFIAEKYAPLRIRQWGSLVHTERFSLISDIDIAIEGLTNETVFAAFRSDVESMTDFPVDIVAMEKLDSGRAELIRSFGIVSWERNS